jgi:hypothetical protein
MRYGLLVLGITICITLYQGWFAGAYDHATTAALTEDARLAIEVRCQLQDDRAGRECRATLKKLYLGGALDPDRTLRFYCDSVKNGGRGGRRPAPPEMCIQRYGGWRAS